MLGHAAFSAAPRSALPGPRAFLAFGFRLTSFLKEGVARFSFGFGVYANWDFRVRTASEDYGPLKGTLRNAFKFSRSIVGSAEFGQVTTGSGEMEIINTEGDYDLLIRSYAVDGRPVTVRIGQAGMDPADFPVLYAGTAAGWFIDEDSLQVRLQDRGYRLDVPVQPNTYGGTGGADGTADLKGKRKPLALGWNLNIEPPLVVPNQLAYQISDGPVRAIPAVYSRGVLVTPGPDYPSLDALFAATIAPGTFATCLASGWFRVNFVLEGQVTADVAGDASGAGFVETTASIVRRLVTRAGIQDPGELDPISFGLVEGMQPAPIGIWIGVDDEPTVNDTIAKLMSAVGGWAGFRRAGQYEIGIVQAPSGVPVERLTPLDIVTIERRELPDGITPPPWRYRVAYARNNTVQTDLAGSVAQDRVATLAQPYRLSTASSAQVKVDHPLAKDPDPVEAYFRDAADAQAEADRRLALYGRTNSLYRIVLARAALLEMGDVLHVTFPRWDLTAGRLLRVVSIDESYGQDGTQTDTIDIMAFG